VTYTPFGVPNRVVYRDTCVQKEKIGTHHSD
jgi:hypothetical protein